MAKTFDTSRQYDPQQFLHRVVWPHYFVFKVMAVADAHVILFDHYHAPIAYEVVFGSSGNSQTVIRKQR